MEEVLTSNVGELIQHDSSQHLWAPKAGRKWWLITSIDDHSRFMFYAKLVERDTTWPHIVAIRHIFMKYGLPMSFYVDSDSIFRFVRGRDELHYKFRGKVRRWADADTPIVLIDQGFGKWIIQRLRGIDAPEIGTLPGQRARKWVENELKDVENLVIKTYKTDKWDRYLVDVFYLPKETDLHRIAAAGLWLNGRMVEAGIAKVWKR